MAQFNETSPGAGKAATVAVISAGVLITGNVECDGAIQVSGRIDGELRCPTVFVDEAGVVDGAVEAERVRVAGVVNGTTTANDLAVEVGGTISGQVSYERIKVASGGIINGSFTHRAKQQSADGEAPLKLVTQPEAASPRRVYVD